MRRVQLLLGGVMFAAGAISVAEGIRISAWVGIAFGLFVLLSELERRIEQ